MKYLRLCFCMFLLTLTNGTISLTTDSKTLYPKGRYDIHYTVCRDETCVDYKTYRIQLLVE